ncbi:MAG: VWA domain-containing protein [Micrococcales bacterium]|nr:VWA domain-containing protein [Micrococcales bacterium]
MSRMRGLAAVVAVALLAACTSGSDDGASDGPDVLRVLAGSEVQDMLPILAEAKDAIGVDVRLDFSGTIEGTELVAAGGAAGTYDATWFPNNRYLSLLPGAETAIRESVKIMSSPVVLGLTPAAATRLGWDTTAPSWADIADAAADGELTYGMTNPAASNSGFSALVSVATALSGTGSALTPSDIDGVLPELTKFATGQQLTAGSSGWLADRYRENPSAIDGIVNYESVLMGMQAEGMPLTIVVPRDGVVTSDYPLTLLSSADGSKRALFDQLTAWLTTPDVQRKIVDQVHRRPGVPSIDTGSTFPSGVLFETPFPNTIETANSLISAYLGSARAPAQAVFVLDTSGSMEGDRIASLQTALKNLAGADTSTVGAFTRFRGGERISLLTFSTTVADPVVVDIPRTDLAVAYQQITDFADHLPTNGGTAVYDALASAYGLAVAQKQERPDTFVSVVLMTDGENNSGRSLDDFRQLYPSLGDAAADIPTFVVLFGDTNADEMQQVADLTGGQTFDARGGDLARAFREIRGYQ